MRSLRYGLMSVALLSSASLAQEMIAYRGRCHSLTLFDRQESRRCADTVATIALPDGLTGFVFTTDDNTLVSFTAPSTRRTDAGGKTVLIVDQVNFVFCREGEAIPATGRCEADDPTVWRASIKCEASTSRGRVAADASSLGGPGERLYGMPNLR